MRLCWLWIKSFFSQPVKPRVGKYEAVITSGGLASDGKYYLSLRIAKGDLGELAKINRCNTKGVIGMTIPLEDSYATQTSSSENRR